MKEQNCPKEDFRKALGGNHSASALGFRPKNLPLSADYCKCFLAKLGARRDFSA